MFFEGDVEVLRNLFRRKASIKRGDSCDIRLLLLVNSGILRGAYGAGQASALETFGLNHVFDVAVGVSTGLPVLSYLLAEQAREQGNIYWNEAASKNFISFRRALVGEPIADMSYLCDEVFRVKLDQEAVRRSRTELYAGITRIETGEGIFLDAKQTLPDVVEAIHATCAMPGLSAGPVEIGGTLYSDGATSMSFPARQVIERFKPTDLLIFANRSGFKKTAAFWNYFVSMSLLQKYPERLQRIHMLRHERALNELAYLRAQKECRYLILWTDDVLGRFTRDPVKLEQAASRAQRHLETLLADAQARVTYRATTLMET
jgi:predicted patatin/cPLA2 family phospholipase